MTSNSITEDLERGRLSQDHPGVVEKKHKLIQVLLTQMGIFHARKGCNMGLLG